MSPWGARLRRRVRLRPLRISSGGESGGRGRRTASGERPTSVVAPQPGGPPAGPGRRGPGAQTRLSPPKSSETEVSSKTASMASAMILATDSTSSLSKIRSSATGSVSVTTTREMGAALRRSTAGSDRTAWVAMAEMSEAPASDSSSAAAQMVPAVSIMSSIRTQWRPSTSPTTWRALTSL